MKQLKLYCMRGLPGSGKSTKAKEIASEHRALSHFVQVFSTDDFWDKDGPYTFVPAKIHEAHLWNQHRAMKEMIVLHASEKGGVIIIDNTHTTARELHPYVGPAHLLNFEITIVEPSTSWAFDADECAKRTIHNVPLDTIRKMLSRYEKGLTVEMCIAANAPWKK